MHVIYGIMKHFNIRNKGVLSNSWIFSAESHDICFVSQFHMSDNS